MMTQWIRVIVDQGALVDSSMDSQDETAFAVNLTANTQYIYIGQHYAFNNFYMLIGTANAVTSTMSLEYWNRKEWVPAVDVMDGTKVGAVTMARSGVVQFSPDNDFGNWDRVSETSKEGSSFGLETLDIYNMFWLRVKVSATLTSGATLKNLSYAFTNDRMLRSVDPELDKYLTAWGGVSKTNWNEQIRLGSQHVIADLKSRQLVTSNGSVLRFDDVCLAATYRTLLQIYAPFGEGFNGKRQWAEEQYKAVSDIKRYSFDKNNNAELELGELNQTTGSLVR